MGDNELSGGHVEFEMPLGYLACQAVGSMSRKLRDRDTSGEERRIKICHH